MRKIVMLPKHEWLGDAFVAQTVSSELATSQYKTDGMDFVEEGYPVRMPHLGYRSLRDDHSYVVTAEFESDASVDEFLDHTDAEGVFSDPSIWAVPTVSPTSAVGNTADVLSKLNIEALHQANGKGGGVKIVVVDTGIDGTQINVAGGYNPRPGVAPGTSPPDHGTMVAYDALIAVRQVLHQLQNAGADGIEALTLIARVIEGRSHWKCVLVDRVMQFLEGAVLQAGEEHRLTDGADAAIGDAVFGFLERDVLDHCGWFDVPCAVLSGRTGLSRSNQLNNTRKIPQ